MKIDFISFDQVPSFKGASQHILAGLRKVIERHEVRLITLGEAALPRYHGLVHHPVAIREKNYLKRGLRFRERVLSLLDSRVDIVHFRTPWEGLAIAARGLPAVYEVNGLPSVEVRYHYKNVPPTVLDTFRGWERQCLAHASMIVCPSDRIRNFLLERDGDVIRSPIRVFNNAYEPRRDFHLEAESRSRGLLRIVYLGTLSPWQGVLWSLRALSELREDLTFEAFAPSSRTLGRYFLRRVERFNLSGAVSLEPPIGRAEMSERLARFDIGFAPLLATERNTEQGCFPIKLFDYLTHGLPIVASDLEVNRQVVVDGVNGRLFRANTSRDLIRVLRDLIEDRTALESLRKGIPATLEPHWSWDRYSVELERLYGSLAERSSSTKR